MANVGLDAATSTPARAGPTIWATMKPDMFSDCARSGENPARADNDVTMAPRAARPGESSSAPKATIASSSGKFSTSSAYSNGISAIEMPLRKSASLVFAGGQCGPQVRRRISPRYRRGVIDERHHASAGGAARRGKHEERNGQIGEGVAGIGNEGDEISAKSGTSIALPDHLTGREIGSGRRFDD